MPVEESGNMLLMLGALATLHDDVSLSQQYWPTISKWIAYLESKGFDPENQLSTDDFAGHLAHNANLSLKAILAIAAGGDLARRRGDDAEAARLRDRRDRHGREMGRGGQGRRSLSSSPSTGPGRGARNTTWSGTRCSATGCSPTTCAAASWPTTRPARTPTACRSTTAPTTRRATGSSGRRRSRRRPATSRRFVDPLLAFLDETPDRVPFSDWYSTTSGLKRGFQARSVVGGVFIPMLSSRDVVRQWSSRPGL